MPTFNQPASHLSKLDKNLSVYVSLSVYVCVYKTNNWTSWLQMEKKNPTKYFQLKH